MTQQEFLSYVSEMNTGYDFSGSVYVAKSKPLEVVCAKHGKFKISLCDLLRGRGCKGCAKDKHQARMNEEMTEAGKSFIENSKNKYGNRFDYAKVEYKGHNKPVIIFCYEHGDMSITPDSHLNGETGCRQCGLNKKANQFSLSNEEFIQRVVSQNSDYSPVDETEYRGFHERVSFSCKYHSKFIACASVLMRGKGCPSCAKFGYRVSEKGSMYVLVSENIVKIGITNRAAKKRAVCVSRSSGRVFEVLREFRFLDGAIPFKLETTLLRELRTTHKQPTETFDGSTECFYDVDRDWLIARIEHLIKEFSA